MSGCWKAGEMVRAGGFWEMQVLIVVENLDELESAKRKMVFALNKSGISSTNMDPSEHLSRMIQQDSEQG